MHGNPNLPTTIDVRQIVRPMRHPLIFSTFDRIGPKGSLHIISDHDPRPLRYLFDVKYPGAFTWDYVESGPKVWRVRLAPAAGPSMMSDGSETHRADRRRDPMPISTEASLHTSR